MAFAADDLRTIMGDHRPHRPHIVRTSSARKPLAHNAWNDADDADDHFQLL